MKKRAFCITLILCMTLSHMMSQFWLTASAAENYFNDDDVTWLGNEKEYKKTLESMYDNGLRKVPAGDMQADGSLKNIKYGLADKYGKWWAEPIYDEIQAYFISGGKEENPLTESIFVDGYVQAIRNGRMGLLDSTGKEVIPCSYDAVGLPAEGISRIIKKSGNRYYLGYWSLKKGKEIVKPNKYPVNGYDATAYGTPANYEPLSRSAEWEIADEKSDYYKSTGSNRVAVQYDFNGGYALVPTGKTESIYMDADTVLVNTGKSYANLIYAQIIDTYGKEILKGGPYPYREGGIYPQAGPYMIYYQLKKEKLTLKKRNISFNSYLAAGVAGEKGIIIKAQYHGGIRGNSATGWYPADANMQIIAEQNLFITAKEVSGGKNEDGARVGVINVKNKTVIPFKFSYESPIVYDSENKVFVIDAIYRPDGKKIANSDYEYGKARLYDGMESLYYANGYLHLWDKYGNHSGVLSIKTGKVYTHKNLKSPYAQYAWEGYSNVSKDGTLWLSRLDKNGDRKWGLVNINGKIVLPFEYDTGGSGDAWTAKNGYAIVKKNGKWGAVDTKGKVLVPCSYWSVSETGDYFVVADDSGGTALYGIYSRSGKILCECNYTGIAASLNGAFKARIGPSLEAVINERGEVITDTYISVDYYGRGLFCNSNNDLIGPDGMIVFPRKARTGKYNNKEVYCGEDLTVVVKGGKVGYINASRLKTKSFGLPATPLIKPEESPYSGKASYHLVKYPSKRVYKLGEAFESNGLIVHLEDVNAVRKVLDISGMKLKNPSIGSFKLSDSYKFTKKGIYTMQIYYDDENTGLYFDLMVLDPAQTGDLLDNGTYTIGLNGKYLKIVNGYIELWNTLPADKFIVRLVNYDSERGPMYYIMTEDGQYVAQGSSSQGDQLILKSTPHAWRINKYSKFCTIRDYGKQNMLVNASGASSKNGTKITIWSYKGSDPEHGKVTFKRAD